MGSMKIDKEKLSSKKPGVDDYFAKMFGSAPGDVREIEISKLIPFEGQPFKPYSEAKLRELAENISLHGVLSPLIVRPFENAYQILAGHNRAAAAKLSGLEVVPCIVMEVDDNTAQLIMLNTNLNQRDKLLPSEKAFAYKMQLEAMKRQGKRTEPTSSQFGTKLRSDEKIAADSGDSRNQIHRYIRLTELVPDLLEMVDDEEMPFGAGVSLSYLKKDAQQELLRFMLKHNIPSVSLAQADNIKQLGDVSDEWLSEVFGIKTADSKREKKSVSTVNLKLPVELFAGRDVSKIKNDGELYLRIAETINKYFEEKRG